MIENIFEDVIDENFHNLEEETGIHVQNSQRVQKRIKQKRTTSRHIVIKMVNIKYKERILKTTKKKEEVR